MFLLLSLRHQPNLSFFKLIVDALSTLNISPGQLMPFSWRTLACLDTIEAKYQLKIDVEIVKYSYSVKKFNGCRFGFLNKTKDEPLILNNKTVNDRKCKTEFFFVDKRSLGMMLDSFWTDRIMKVKFSSFSINTCNPLSCHVPL